MSIKKPLFVFFGTPQLSVCVLEQLEAHGLLPALVVTAPDRESGRGLQLTPSPVKQWALARGIDTLTPTTLRDEALLAELANTQWDLFVVAMYNKIIPKSILDLPTHGCLNVHPSLLPQFRGPSPILSAILADARTTGVSIMKLDEKMDEGPVLAQARIELEETDWPPKGSEFELLLATEGGNLLAETIPLWLAGKLPEEVQNHTEATYTKKFTTEDALIDPLDDPRAQLLKIKAFDKSPRAHFFTASGKRVIVVDAEMVEGKLVLTRVIPEGKKEMSYEDFLRGQSA